MPGYGNHSCSQCQIVLCPIKETGPAAELPNKCSFYWPPNAQGKPGQWLMRQLNRMRTNEIRGGK